MSPSGSVGQASSWSSWGHHRPCISESPDLPFYLIPQNQYLRCLVSVLPEASWLLEISSLLSLEEVLHQKCRLLGSIDTGHITGILLLLSGLPASSYQTITVTGWVTGRITVPAVSPPVLSCGIHHRYRCCCYQAASITA